MPYEIVWESREVRVGFCAVVTADELVEAFVQVHADERYDEVRCMLVDYRSATAIEASDLQWAELACIDYAAALSNPRVALAHVADDARVVSQLEHHLANNGSMHQQGIFSRLEHARAWIDSQRLNFSAF